MIVYKVWDERLRCWCAAGVYPGGSGNTHGKIWPAAGRLAQAIWYRFGSKTRAVLKIMAGEAYADKEVVIFEMVEKERLPLKDWVERQQGATYK